mmetsp:Transcript_27096/g.68880  ORF Transcript_27096/g.68880 Transcript_27096/m.68880 type:complete len:214 (+) Transcript_27096:526-1167(+)
MASTWPSGATCSSWMVPASIVGSISCMIRGNSVLKVVQLCLRLMKMDKVDRGVNVLSRLSLKEAAHSMPVDCTRPRSSLSHCFAPASTPHTPSATHMQKMMIGGPSMIRGLLRTFFPYVCRECHIRRGQEADTSDSTLAGAGPPKGAPFTPSVSLLPTSGCKNVLPVVPTTGLSGAFSAAFISTLIDCIPTSILVPLLLKRPGCIYLAHVRQQ